MEEEEVRIIVPDGYEIDKERSTFECVKFKKKEKEYPKNWDEFVHVDENREGAYPFRRGFADFNDVDEDIAFAALGKLIQLRDWWWDNMCDGWRPDWENSVAKYTIFTYLDKFSLNYNKTEHRTLAFPTSEIRDKFFEAYKDLIKKAKMFL